MATTEDRQHAQRLIYQYRRRLYILEERKARQGDNADPAVDIELDELRLNIATLEALVEPEPADEVKAVVQRHVESDWAMMFAQMVKFGQRLTKVEERVDTVVQSQASAQLWRIDITDRLAVSDAARQWGQRRNLMISLGTLVLLIFAVILLVWWF